MTPELTVSIISNDNRDLALACIDSVYRNSDGMEVEVIVVENASRDGSAEAIAARFPGVKLIRNEAKEGFSANNNKAIRQARGELILLLNDDTVVHPGALGRMAGFLRAHPEAGAVGGTLLNADGTPQHTGKRRPTMMAAMFISLGLHRVFPQNPYTRDYYFQREGYGEAEEVDHINGACLMTRRKTVEQVGYLDEGFFLFCEDVDWCLRMKDAGWKIYYLPEAKITHYRGKSTGGRRIVWIYHRSLFRFYRKHYAKGRLFLVNWLVYLAISLRFLAYWAYGNVRRRT